MKTERTVYRVFDRGYVADDVSPGWPTLEEGLDELARWKYTWPNLADAFDLRKITIIEEVVA